MSAWVATTYGRWRPAQTLLGLLVAWSLAAQAQPSVPSGLSATPSNAAVTLTWSDPSDASITSYSVRHATSSSTFTGGAAPAWRTIGGSGATTTAHTVSGLTNGTRYYFQLGATNGVGRGPASQTTIRLAVSPAASVSIPDANLRAILEGALGKSAGAAITQLEMANLKGYLQANWAMVANLAGLEHAVNLRELYCFRNNIADLSPLSALTRLTRLSLVGNSITDVSHLGALTSLAMLALSDNSIADVSTLASLTSLSELYLSDNSISDVSRLGTLTSLTRLSLSDNSIADISALAPLASLSELSLSENSISDVSALGALTALTRLKIDRNAIVDVSTLGALRSLTRLDLHDNFISDVSPLGALRSLTRLYLHNNSISDISSLRTLTSLIALDLHDNSISDISALSALASPTWLYLHDNSIRDVSALRALTSLAVLSLGDNSISDITPLGALTSLTQLWLDNNSITDIAALESLEALIFVDLRGNPLSEESVRARIPALRARGVRVLFDPPAPPPAVVEFADAGLRDIVARAIGKSAGEPLTATDLLTLRELDAADAGIEDLSGLEAASELERVVLAGNRVRDLAPLSSLTSLRSLDLSRNDLSDISALADLASLDVLLLSGNALRDLAPLSRLTDLRELDLADNAILDVAALSGLVSLEWLRLSSNRIENISPLANLSKLRLLMLNENALESLAPLDGLRSLEELHVARNRIVQAPPSALPALERLRLTGNRIADLAPFLSNDGLGEGDVVGLRGNPLSAASIERHLPALRARGVAVLAGVPVPMFPSNSDSSGRQGFVRVLNRSNVGGEVWIFAVDDAGARFGPVRLAMGAAAAAHFNSRDLEEGNDGKGLSGRIEPPRSGAWRLELLTTLDIEALAYARTPDGFVTSMGDVLPRDELAQALRVAVFNPGGNHAQRSSLRLLNPGGVAEEVSVLGVDDDGSGRLATGLSALAGSALTVRAAELERGRGAVLGSGLGVGEGKWRLDVHAPWPVEAVNLLTSSSGHLTNLSTVPKADADGVWRVPLFPAGGDAWRQGFVRVTNRGGRGGEVRIQAADDGGNRVGPVSLSLGAYQSAHLNSDDWERGNTAKGLSAGVGPPTRGDWRLALTSALDLRVTAFIRHGDGFLTSMHDASPRDATGAVTRVAFFNPGSNRNQRSLLRLINNGDAAATVAIAAIDDAGKPGGDVTVTVSAREALTLAADELETGGARFSGALGDGAGKWRLTVSADVAITVLSLLRSASGHLTNLSGVPPSAEH